MIRELSPRAPQRTPAPASPAQKIWRAVGLTLLAWALIAAVIVTAHAS